MDYDDLIWLHTGEDILPQTTKADIGENDEGRESGEPSFQRGCGGRVVCRPGKSREIRLYIGLTGNRYQAFHFRWLSMSRVLTLILHMTIIEESNYMSGSRSPI